LILLLIPFTTPQNPEECLTCETAFVLLDDYIAQYGNDILQFVQPICIFIAPYLNNLLGAVDCNETEVQTCIDLCEGMITSWGPVIADVFVALELTLKRHVLNWGFVLL